MSQAMSQTTNPENLPPNTPEVPFRVLLQPLLLPLRRHWGLVAMAILTGWAKFLLPMGIPWLTKHIIDDLLSVAPGSAAKTSDALGQLGFYALILCCLMLALAVATFYRSYFAERFAALFQHHLRRHLFHHIQRLSMSFFQKHHAGALGSRVSSDINASAVVINSGLIQVAMDLVAGAVCVAFMFVISWQLTLVMLVLHSINAALLWRFAPPIKRQRKSIQESQSSVTGRAAEIFAGISVVKAFSSERAFGQVFSNSSANVRDLQLTHSRLSSTYAAYSQTLSTLANAAIVFIGALIILKGWGALTAGGLVAFLLYNGLIAGSIQRLTDSMIQIQDGVAALERIHDILEIEPTPADAPNAVEHTLSGSMQFEHVTFSYADRTIIRDFSFTFQSGRSYALVGPSGSGKSTMARLMLRFYDPEKGVIKVDGRPLKDIQQSCFRRQVAVVMQEPVIFSGSVADNISLSDLSIRREDIIVAAEKAEADEFIRRLPKGYDTPLGERGATLSGGQRQRVAIARALMRDPKMLILDEATSALDTVTERSIQEVIDHLHGSRTIIVIAHRLSTIRNVDEILVLDQGQLIENGSWDDLIAKNGVFARLVETDAHEIG